MEAQRRRLQHHVQGLSVMRVSSEVAVLSRLLYRNKSQHRRELAYQKSVRVAKECKKYQSSDLLSSTRSSARSLSSLSVEEWRALSRGRQRRLQAADCAQKLLQCSITVVGMIEFIESTFSTISMTLYAGHFVSYHLTVAASMSRLWFLLCCHLMAIADCYDIMRPFSGPSGSQANPPPSVQDYLGRRYSRYLDGSLTGKISKESVTVCDSKDATLTSGCRKQELSTDSDIGDLVTVDEEQNVERIKDFNDVSVVTYKLCPHVTVESVPPESSSRDCEQRTRVCKAKPLPNTLMVITRTLTGRVHKLTFGGRQSISRLQRRKTVTSLVFKDVNMRKGKQSKKVVVQCGNIQFCAVRCLPSRKLFKRHMLKRTALIGKEHDVQELQTAFSTELEAAAHDNLSTAVQDFRTTPHSVNSKVDDIDGIFSAIL